MRIILFLPSALSNPFFTRAGETIIEVIGTDLNGLPSTSTMFVNCLSMLRPSYPITLKLHSTPRSRYADDNYNRRVSLPIQASVLCKPFFSAPGRQWLRSSPGTVPATRGLRQCSSVRASSAAPANMHDSQTITPVAQPVGPVGQPGPTGGTAGALTPYTYTTTNAAGDTIPVVATFTPSFATTVMPSVTFKATVLDYSDYTASYATAQVATSGNSNSNGARQQSAAWWAPCVSVMTGMIGGMVLPLGA